MVIPEHLQPFWRKFAHAHGSAVDDRFYDVCVFGDSEQLASELAALVLRGIKRATAGSVFAYEDAGLRAPQAGDLSVVTDWTGTPLCVIETLSTEIVAFKDVTAEFAATEGEGDGSLTFWRSAHKEYFERECSRTGRTFTENLPLVCERFQVVYRATPSAA